MDEARDPKGRPIRLQSRVYVPPRPSNLVAGHMVAGFSGTVTSVEQDPFWGTWVIGIRESGSWNLRTVHATDVRVQYGRNRTSRADATARDAVRKARRRN